MLDARSLNMVSPAEASASDAWAHDLVDLCDRLEARGACVAVGGDVDLLEVYTRLGLSSPMLIRWLPGTRMVQITQRLEVRIASAAAVARAALAVAQVNGSLGVPALVLDVDDRFIDYRTRIFTERDGGLEIELVCQVLAAVVADVERLTPLLDDRVGVEDEMAPEPWTGYSD